MCFYLECKIEHFKPRRMILMEWFYFPNSRSHTNLCICWLGRETGELILFSRSTSERNWNGCDLVGPMIPKLVQNCKRRSESSRSVYVENTNVMLRCWKYCKIVLKYSNQLSLTRNTQNRLKLGRLFLFELAQVCLNLTKIAVGHLLGISVDESGITWRIDFFVSGFSLKDIHHSPESRRG